MARMTEKENLLRTIKGEVPEWVPRYNMATVGDPYCNHPPAVVPYCPEFLSKHTRNGLDIWGVEYVTTKETGYQALPKPNTYILDDICKWRDVIKAPDVSGYDWDKMAKDDLESLGIDRRETATSFKQY